MQTDMPDDAKFLQPMRETCLITAPLKQQTGRRGRGQGHRAKAWFDLTAVWTAGFVVEDGKLGGIRPSKGSFATKNGGAGPWQTPEKAEIREPTLSRLLADLRKVHLV